MNTLTYDTIVIGVGGMGSAAVLESARRGARVLGLEQFPLVHDRGSSHGLTRIIRSAYFEHPDYVPLVRRSFERWYDLEQLTGRRLLTDCDCLIIGPPEGEVVTGTLRAAREHELPVESLAPEELSRRYPTLRFGDEYVGVLEHNAGVLHVEDCVRAHIDAAIQLGAHIHAKETVTDWEAVGQGVRVRTDQGEYHASNLIVTAGPWANQFIKLARVPLTVMRQVTLWFATRDDRLFRRDVFPVYFADLPGGCAYGLPVFDGFGHKVAHHYGAPELSDPAQIERDVTEADIASARAFLREHVPDADGELRKSSVCIYTLTPDRHFIIDRHPEHENVAIAAGFSGHGFKFAPAVGQALVDLVEMRRTELPIRMFNAKRFTNKPEA